jgi:hypothetical protein
VGKDAVVGAFNRGLCRVVGSISSVGLICGGVGVIHGDMDAIRLVCLVGVVLGWCSLWQDRPQRTSRKFKHLLICFSPLLATSLDKTEAKCLATRLKHYPQSKPDFVVCGIAQSMHDSVEVSARNFNAR